MAKGFVSILKQIARISIPLILGIVILYFLYKGTKFGEMWFYIKTANWGILSFSLIFGLVGNIIRGVRWELLINPLGYYPKKNNLIYAVLGSYAVNFVIPRAGEIWRCGIITQKEKIPFQKLLGTLIIDRVFDMLIVILFILLAFLFNVSVVYKNISYLGLPKILTSPYLYLGCLAILSFCILAIIFLKDNSIVKKIRSFLSSMWSDMVLVWKMKTKKRFILYTFGIWICYFLYFFITFYAFDFTSHLGFAAGLFIFVLGSISLLVPSNGGLGPWQAAIVFGLCIFMINIDEAKAFATGVFAFQSIWVVLCGLVGIFALSLSPKEKSLECKRP